MCNNIEKYIKEYYNLNVENLKNSKLPNFFKIKILEGIRTEFQNDEFAKVRLKPDEYMEIAENIDYLIKKQKALGFLGKRTIKKLLLGKSR